ncbi:unnamed protein product [Urochloa humidicola]
MQDSVGKFVEMSIPVPASGAPMAAAAVSKEIAFDDHSWTVHCYPRGAPGDPGAGDHLSIVLVNHTNARNAKVLFEAIVLCRADLAGGGGNNGVAPPRENYHTGSVLEYPARGTRRFPWPRVVSAADLRRRCAVGGYATVVCGLAVLRHNPIPAPPSTYAADLAGLLVDARRKFGRPDASFSVGGRTFDVVRRVLAARSAVLKAELDAASTTTSEASTTTTTTIRPEHGFSAATFCAVLVYVYCDRLPRGGEAGCAAAATTEEVGELLAAAEWYELGRLKQLCARRLWDGLCVGNVSRTLRYAVRGRCPELRSACIDFLTVGDNLKEAFPTEDFGWLMRNSPEVYEEIRRRFEAKSGGLAASGDDDDADAAAAAVAVVCTGSSSGQSSLSG